MDELAANLEPHLELGAGLVEALDLLESKPQVSLTNKPLRIDGTRKQDHQAQVRLLCCRKPIGVRCNELTGEQATPNLLVAAQKLAQKVDKAEHKNSRAAKQASSMRRMAEEMDLPVSSDEEEEEETRHSNGRQQAREAALVVRQRDDLRRMLGKLGWPAGGAAAS